MALNPQWLAWISVTLIALGAAYLVVQYVKSRGKLRHIDAVLEARQASSMEGVSHFKDLHWSERLMQEPASWLATSWGKQLVAAEDLALLVQCGFQSANSKAYYLLARITGLIFLPLLALLIVPWLKDSSSQLLMLGGAAIVGFLAPKWYLRGKASKRRKQAARELPLLVDMLGLLQGAGLGIDQSLQLIARDFRHVMPVIAGELDLVNRLYASGRTREQALHRMSEMFQSDAMADLSALIVQIDKHGGAVQEPLRQFGERLREQRRMHMKEQIGKITVKMTVIMILTLLPSLLIVVAGPAFLSVIRALGSM